MKFIADAMVGRLAKWLRIMGFDVLYYPDIEDRELIRIAREQERTIITRDTGLIKAKGIKEPIFIGADNLPEQLSQILPFLDFGNAHPQGRCELCNGLLSKVPDKKEIRELVPDFVYFYFSSFVICGSCGKVYWEGSHYKKIRETLGNLTGSDPCRIKKK